MNNEERNFIKLTPFKLQVIQSFPYIDADFDALTNYQLFQKIVEYLNTTVSNVDLLNEKVTEFENYFDTLDVTEEINNKLDQMAEDGTLTLLIKNYVDPIYEDFERDIEVTIGNQNSTITNAITAQNTEISNFKSSVNSSIEYIDGKVDSVASGTPAGVYATVSALTTADPDHSKIYVVAEDGKWYYYNTQWTAGSTYQSTAIANNSVDYNNLTTQLQKMFSITINPTVIAGTYITRSGGTGPSAQYSITDTIALKKGESIYLKGATADTISAIARVNSNGTYTSLVNGLNNTAIMEYNYTATYDVNIKLCFRNDYNYNFYKYVSTPNLYNQDRDIKPNYLLAYNSIVAIGDSLTYSQVYTSNSASRQAYKPYPEVLAKLIGATSEILATPGATTQWWWNNYKNQLNNSNKDNLFIIYLGSNGGLTDTLDTDAPVSEQDYNNYADTNTGCYAKIVAKCKSLGGKILIIPPFTVGNDPTALTTTISVIDQICERFGVVRINSIELTDLNYHYYPNFSGYNSSHMNDVGYAVFAQKVINEVEKLNTDSLTRLILE